MQTPADKAALKHLEPAQDANPTLRVKVGGQWFAVEPDRPLLIELTEGDKQNIANMAPGATRYAVFSDLDQSTSDDKLAWMKD